MSEGLRDAVTALGPHGLGTLDVAVIEALVRKIVADEIEAERRALPDPVPGHLGRTRVGDDCSWAMARARDIALYGLGEWTYAQPEEPS